MFTDMIREQAAECGLRIITVDGRRTEQAVTAESPSGSGSAQGQT